MKKIITCIFLFLNLFFYGQTKEDCLQFIKTVSKTLDGNLFIDAKLLNNKLILVRHATGGEIWKSIEKQTLDMSKVESVVIEKSTSYYQIFINFKGNFYQIDKYENIEDYKSNKSKVEYGFKDNWVNIFSTTEESKALKIQKYFIALSKHFGSKAVAF